MSQTLHQNRQYNDANENNLHEGFYQWRDSVCYVSGNRTRWNAQIVGSYNFAVVSNEIIHPHSAKNFVKLSDKELDDIVTGLERKLNFIREKRK